MEITKKITLLILLLVAAVYKVSAQKKINEGIVTYNVSYELNAVQLQYADQLPKKITFYFRGDSTAATIKQGSAIVKGVSVFKANFHSLLVELPATSKKIVVVMTPAEVEEEKAENPHLKAVTGNEKQIIDGYNCYKVTATNAKNGESYEIWVTNDIDMPPNSISKPVSGFGGVPVLFVTFNRGIRINAEIEEIKETAIPPGFFSATKEYQPMSFTDLQALSGGN
ncbi:MAG: DUF4412 domain-containing protein [Sphingobacteriales bacterium]